MATRARILSLMLAAAVLPQWISSAPVGVEAADYRGSDAVLLTAGSTTITERQFLEFALLTEAVDPSQLRNWKTADPGTRAKIRKALELQLRTILTANAPEAKPGAPTLDFDRRATRIIAAPAARWIWADTVVRNAVTIFPEDVIYLYLNKAEEFSTPETATLRRLRVPIALPITLEGQNVARQQAEELRREALAGGGLEPILKEHPELLVDPPGRTVEVTRKSTELDDQILDAAFTLGLEQISPPLRTPGAVFLIEVVDKTKPQATDLEAVRPKIEEKLTEKFLPQQYDYSLAVATTDSFPTNHANIYAFIPEDADIVRVRRFALTKDEFKTLYPEKIGDGKYPNKAAIVLAANDIIYGEVITQDLEKKKTADDSFYRESLTIADQIYRATKLIRANRAGLKPSDAEVAAYLEANREKVTPGVAKKLWKLELSARDSSRLSRSELDSMRILMQSYLAETTAAASRQLEERKQISAEGAFNDPDKVLRSLPQPQDLRVKSDFSEEGTYTREKTLKELNVDFDALQLGKFSAPVRIGDDSLASYFVSSETASAEPSREELLALARAALVTELSSAGVEKQVDDLKKSGGLRFNPDLSEK